MKKILFLFLTIIAAGCSQFDEVPAIGKPACVAEVRFSMPDMVLTATRSVDENAIEDIHLFLFGPQNYYRLVGSGEVQVRVEIARTGAYTAIAITNCDDVHSGMNLTELSALTFSGTSVNGRIVMSGRAEIEVTKSAAVEIDIQLERALSKVSFNIRVDDNYNFGIFSVRLCSVPERGFVVGQDNAMPTTGYVDYDETIYDYVGSVEYGGIYLPENLKGRNISIYDAKMRGLDNAPANSTYLHVRGMRLDNSEVYDYYILLGENITSDFNVRRNRHYRFDILLKTYPHGADTRVFYYHTILVEKNQWDIGLHSKHSADQEIIGSLTYWGEADYTLRREIVFDMDNWADVELNGQYLTSPVVAITPESSYRIRYYQDRFIPGVNDLLTYSIVTTDQFGYSTFIPRNFTCHNKVIAEYNLEDDRYQGALSYYNESAWFWGPKYPDRLCCNYMEPSYGSSVRLGASGTDGAVFSAWYEDERGGKVITTESSWSFYPKQSITRMYAAFTSATPDSVKVFTDVRRITVTCWDADDGDAPVEHTVDPSFEFFTVPVGTTCRLSYYTHIYWYPTRYSKSSWLRNSNTVILTPTKDVMYWPGIN